MFQQVDTRDAVQVERAVGDICLGFAPDAGRDFVRQAFQWVRQCFAGEFDAFQAIDARYHDLEHTLQATLCLARLLDGRRRAGAAPAFSPRWFELSLLAVLFHDSGYLKKRGDNEGTGAKYTPVHVSRSAEFAALFLGRQAVAPHELKAIQNMIGCTGVNADISRIPFQCEEERIAGFALATADLLGQMAAGDYVEKLALLHAEFAEAARFNPEQGAKLAIYKTPEELVRNTPGFWRNYVWPRLNNEYGKLYWFLDQPDATNPYLARIEANLAKIGL